MAHNKAPKLRELTSEETIGSFENWRQKIMYALTLDDNFKIFLGGGFTWGKQTSTNPLRGFTDDGDAVPEAQRRTAVQKSAQMDLMLGQIANYCEVISRSSILKNSISLNDIWQKIRLHFGFQSTGGHFLDLASIRPGPNEKPEDLYQRLLAFFEDNLMTETCGITHHGLALTSDEDLTPTLENTVVLLWLQLVNTGLPQLVKQRYGAELRNKSLASLKPEISQALPSLLDEIRSIEDTKAMRSSTFTPARSTKFSPRSATPKRYTQKSSKSCVLCQTAGRPGYASHFLTECKFLPPGDKKALTRARLTGVDDEDDDNDDYSGFEEDFTDNAMLDQPSANRVRVIQSPFLNMFYFDQPVHVTLDTGATTNMVKASFAKSLNLPLITASQVARQADGVTNLDVVGEVHFNLTRGDRSYAFHGLAVDKLDVNVLAGNPFLATNDIGTRPAKNQIVIGGSEVVYYGQQTSNAASVRRTQAYLLRCPRQQTLLPGDFVQLALPDGCELDSDWALEPRIGSPANMYVKDTSAWPHAQAIEAVGRHVRVTNSTGDPILLRRHEHVCQVRPLSIVEGSTTSHLVDTPSVTTVHAKPFSQHLSLDPDSSLSDDIRAKFSAVNLQYDDVFDPVLSKYNGASGKIEAVVNMGPTLPPQRKGRLPHYNRETLCELQKKFDELEEVGVFAKPEAVNVTVEYLNLSFLVKKPNGGSRLVTSFGEVAQYSKPQPSLMPNVDSTLRDIARWKYIIVTDLLKSFYQIPLARQSMKFCGVATPFKGIRVYTRSAMGMPGSETCLEELLSRVLGDLIQGGNVAKIADDLYIGGDTPEIVLTIWSRVLEVLQRNNLKLSASKTILFPTSTTILGWTWRLGTLEASAHRLAALASVTPPPTVRGLRSYIGAYKVLSRVIKGYSDFLDPLDKAVAGKLSSDKLDWSDDLISAFRHSQEALQSCKKITMPRPSDCLWIVTDGAVSSRGIAATLYARRDDKLHLAGFFNMKLKKHQVTWMPCEIEGLCIGAAVKHFAPYITQSRHTTQLLTDSRPCVLAFEKLKRGEFSNSSRVTTFLSIVSRYMVHVRHIAGAANLPSDFASRNPIPCHNSSCQLCKFVNELQESVIRSLSIKEVEDGSIKMPFTSRAAWLATQQECPDLRRTHSHLSQGTRPSKKATNIPDVKRYLKDVTISRDSVLVVRDAPPFHPVRERIVVPRAILAGLLTAIHIRFQHPSRYQTKRVFNRYFFALNLDSSVDAVCSSCHHCMSLRVIPSHLHPQTSSPPPDKIGTTFACDVMRRHRQCVFVLRETVTSYTLTSIIDNERHDQIRDVLLVLCAELKSLGDGGVRVRVDPGPGLVALVNDPTLLKHGIALDVGHAKNVNKNPVAEGAIRELGLEILNIAPEGGPVSKVTLALATSTMNMRIRRDGLSARELWTQRDQLTGEQLPIEDKHVILSQQCSRSLNHGPSAVSKAHGKGLLPDTGLCIGDLVYLAPDKDKTKLREKYMVCQVSDDECSVRKFTKSQFRSRLYTVPVKQCYPVKRTFLNQVPSGPIRGLDDGNTDDGSPFIPPTSVSSYTVPDLDIAPYVPPALDDYHTEPVVDEVPPSVAPGPPVQPQQPDPPPQPDPPEAIVTVPIPSPSALRPSRITRAPAWQTNDEWDMSRS